MSAGSGCVTTGWIGAAACFAESAFVRSRNGQANGIVNSVVAAIVNIAATQPAELMIACIKGANTNWPNEPPALMKPDANARRCNGNCFDVAPIKIEKLP